MHKIDDEYSFILINDINSLIALKNKWEILLDKYEIYVPWLSHDWFVMWLQYFRKDREFYILLLYRNDSLVAIAPLISNKKYIKKLKIGERLELIGNQHSPIRSIIFDNSVDLYEKSAILRKIISSLMRIKINWDFIELERIPEEKNIFNIYKKAAIGFKYRYFLSVKNCYIDSVNNSYEEYFTSLPRKHRNDVKRCKRNLNKLGRINFLLKNNDDNIDHFLDLYEKVRNKSWKALEKDKDFLRNFTKLFAQKGCLRIAILYLEQTPIACEKWIVYNNVGYAWDSVYNDDYKRYSPGKVLTAEISKYIIEHDNVHEIDYMTGNQAYKKYWVKKIRNRNSITIFNNTLKGRIFAFWYLTLRPILKKIKNTNADISYAEKINNSN